MAAISYHFIDQEKIKFTYKITLQTMGGCPFSYDMPQRGPVFSVGCTGQPTWMVEFKTSTYFVSNNRI